MRTLKTATVLIALLAVIVGAIALWGNRAVMVDHTTTSAPVKPIPERGRKSVALFFTASGGHSFHEETREIEDGATITEEAKRIVGELIKGPERGDLLPTIPRGTQLLNLFIDASGIAYVDFNNGLRDGLKGGAQGELEAIFSIVNTLASNLVRITRVQILVEGSEIQTLAGHVDTRMALPPQYVF